jgi:hypothetical protein
MGMGSGTRKGCILRMTIPESGESILHRRHLSTDWHGIRAELVGVSTQDMSSSFD